MKISEKFNNDRTVFSLEVFPPKKTSSIESIYGKLDELKEINPDFISVTYGAAGTGASDNFTVQTARRINDMGITAVAHLSCINNTKEDIIRVLDELKKNGIENILALRGDINPDVEPKKDFRYASELTAFIKEHGDFHVSGACYPECHFEAPNMDADIENLKKKVDAGADHLMSQLFFVNSFFFNFLDKVRQAGINVPIEAGIMPVVSKNQIERIVSVCGASFPNKFVKIIQKYESRPEALRDAGIAYAVDQITELVSNGVDGIHLYTMNNPYVAKKISEGIKNLL